MLKRFFITKLPPETFQNDNIKDLYLRNVVQISVREQFPLFTVCGHFRLTMWRAGLGRSLGWRKTTTFSGPNMKILHENSRTDIQLSLSNVWMKNRICPKFSLCNMHICCKYEYCWLCTHCKGGNRQICPNSVCQILFFIQYICNKIRNSYSCLQHMKSIYFTHMLRSFIKYCFYHSKIVPHINMTKIKLTWITHVFFVQLTCLLTYIHSSVSGASFALIYNYTTKLTVIFRNISIPIRSLHKNQGCWFVSAASISASSEGWGRSSPCSFEWLDLGATSPSSAFTCERNNAILSMDMWI